MPITADLFSQLKRYKPDLSIRKNMTATAYSGVRRKPPVLASRRAIDSDLINVIPQLLCMHRRKQSVPSSSSGM